ncbi:MAG: hypothetical protein ACJ788_10965 [Ktedonobacteraceae bacterium]
MIAHLTEPVFGLPGLVAFDARSGVQDVVPAESNEGGSVRLRPSLELVGGAKERTEVGAASAEVLCRGCRHVDLQTAGQQEHAVDTRTVAQVKMVEHAPFPRQHVRPVIKNGLRGNALGDPEGYIDVGPPIPAPKRHRAGERTGGDPWVALRQGKDALTHVVALLCREHGDLLSSSCKAYYHTGPGSENLRTRGSSIDAGGGKMAE